MEPFTLRRRAGGVLMHVTSLPGGHGVGDLGPEAWAFARTLAGAGQRWWQMLPIGPASRGNSPYTSSSTFAGSPLLLSLELLAEKRWLGRADLGGEPGADPARVDYAAAARYKSARLEKAFAAFERAGGAERDGLDAFAAEKRGWLDDYALFAALAEEQCTANWLGWPEDLRARRPEALDAAGRRLAARVRYHKFLQYCFHEQWSALRSYCRELGVGLVGDLPIYVSHASAEVWSQQGLFLLDERGAPTAVAGVPPDYFSGTGQLWGNPLYRWEAHERSAFSWWIERLRCVGERFDAVRLDHFIGLQRYWEIPARAKTAKEGRWQPGPGEAMLKTVLGAVGPLEVIAEDLGAVTPEVLALRDRFDLPGMRILQFAFDGDMQVNVHLPHNHPRRCVVYTGTHDNDTSVGWLERVNPAERERALAYLGPSTEPFHWRFVRLAWMSEADTAIVPAQDLLGLDNRSRMNMPGKADGNWQWRVLPGALGREIADRLGAMTASYGRLVSK